MPLPGLNLIHYDTLINEDGEQVKLEEPQGIELPLKGFDVKDAGYQAPAADGSKMQVRLTLLQIGCNC